ncbi:MAG: ribbon-helix-helix domain-containing protein [Polyangiaceae bacterium]|jgi:predicted transcriptional regulator|nr:ribbon-helix-helix domain-containing protein [Polyangiaceae bacterium]
MSTSVHIPAELLERADSRAKALGISRNRLIIEALEAQLARDDKWPNAFVRVLAEPVSDDLKVAIDEMDDAIRQSRRNRKSQLDL